MRVVDYLALVGDSSDNVPGVKGIGEKTALELLGAYGDLDTILTRAPEVAGKRAREALLQHSELARLSRDLVTIRRDAPVSLDLDRLRVRPPDIPRLRELFTELEFRSLIPKLDRLVGLGAPPLAAGPAPVAPLAAAPPAAPAAVLSEVARLAEVIAEIRRAPLVALDVETSSLDPMRADLVGLSLAGAPGRSWYLPFAHVAPDR